MNRTLLPLDTIQVASPCRASWEEMTGSAQARFCGQCSKFVYNLSGMTRQEAEALVLETEGRLCVRFYRRADGSVLTGDCPVGWRAARRRIVGLGVLAASLLLGVLSFGAIGLASALGGERGRIGGPLGWLADWLSPPRVIVCPPPPGGGVVMGEMCPPNIAPLPPPEEPPPLREAQARP